MFDFIGKCGYNGIHITETDRFYGILGQQSGSCPFLRKRWEISLGESWSLPVAHLHDFTLEIFHSGVGAAVLAARPCVGWSVHVGQKRDFVNPQGVDDDMHMDIPAVVMPVRVGAD